MNPSLAAALYAVATRAGATLCAAVLFLALTLPARAATPEEVDALNFAIADNDLERVQQILDTGINVNSWNEVGLTPLVYAVETFPEESVLNLLFEHGANVNIQMPRNGKTALMKAARNPDAYALVPRLLDEGADVTLVDKQGYTALWAAIELFIYSEEIDPELALENVRLILAAGADPNAPADNLTPLLYAAREGFTPVVELLAENNATMDAMTIENVSALELAQAFEHADTAAFLEEWAANATLAEGTEGAAAAEAAPATNATAPLDEPGGEPDTEPEIVPAGSPG